MSSTFEHGADERPGGDGDDGDDAERDPTPFGALNRGRSGAGDRHGEHGGAGAGEDQRCRRCQPLGKRQQTDGIGIEAEHTENGADRSVQHGQDVDAERDEVARRGRTWRQPRWFAMTKVVDRPHPDGDQHHGLDESGDVKVVDGESQRRDRRDDGDVTDRRERCVTRLGELDRRQPQQGGNECHHDGHRGERVRELGGRPLPIDGYGRPGGGERRRHHDASEIERRHVQHGARLGRALSKLQLRLAQHEGAADPRQQQQRGEQAEKAKTTDADEYRRRCQRRGEHEPTRQHRRGQPPQRLTDAAHAPRPQVVSRSRSRMRDNAVTSSRRRAVT